jgi:hypothetical protein
MVPRALQPTTQHLVGGCGCEKKSPQCGFRNEAVQPALHDRNFMREPNMDGIIYLVGLVVVVLAILSFLGLH